MKRLSKNIIKPIFIAIGIINFIRYFIDIPLFMRYQLYECIENTGILDMIISYFVVDFIFFVVLFFIGLLVLFKK